MGVWGGEERKVGVSEEHTYQVRERRWFVLERPRRDATAIVWLKCPALSS